MRKRRFYTKNSPWNSWFPHFMILLWNQKSRNAGTFCIKICSQDETNFKKYDQPTNDVKVMHHQFNSEWLIMNGIGIGNYRIYFLFFKYFVVDCTKCLLQPSGQSQPKKSDELRSVVFSALLMHEYYNALCTCMLFASLPSYRLLSYLT